MKNVHEAEVFAEPSQTSNSKKGFFSRKKLIAIFAKSSFLDILQGSEYVNNFIFHLVFRHELLLM